MVASKLSHTDIPNTSAERFAVAKDRDSQVFFRNFYQSKRDMVGYRHWHDIAVTTAKAIQIDQKTSPRKAFEFDHILKRMHAVKDNLPHPVTNEIADPNYLNVRSALYILVNFWEHGHKIAKSYETSVKKGKYGNYNLPERYSRKSKPKKLTP